MGRVKALVLTGFGLNCDLETAHCLSAAGAQTERVHLNSLLSGNVSLGDFQIFVVGGGFSWGDDHGAGVIMAMRIKHRLKDDLLEFVHKGGLVLGICNGFQVLVNLGILPAFAPGAFKRDVALIHNDCGYFRDQWVRLTAEAGSPCVFTRGIDTLELPIRHGEGKFYAEPETFRKLRENRQIVLRYAAANGSPASGQFPWNPNGSLDDVAGICDPTGRVFGLMPHPEAYNHWTNHPDWTLHKEVIRRQGRPLPEEGLGMLLFHNAVRHFN
ncbi:MAG: phosphoribosylformylglycinamidine synthase subunit PurQ [Syntrophobacteraceae bacterium]